MTYCVGLLLDAGMVLLSDTRTNAGIDNISTYRKMFLFEEPGERVIAILTAGSLSSTQTTIARLEEDIEHPDSESIMSAPTMLQVAEMVGTVLAEVTRSISGKLGDKAASARASMIVAGQRQGGAARMFLVYPEGNYIEATRDTPFLQIGEHKYGKPILDRVVTPETSLGDGQKAALLSMDSTLRSNLSVGMPLDLAVIEAGTQRVSRQRRIEAEDEVFQAMSVAWSKALRDAFVEIEI
ncbi:putative proteasome-type protease [Palleronia aestuarii]|uniref:Putative proteasome-type protease n=1 Tax=Palleronia aestuarii TaxID=568105 RepID=A0A2W7N7K1_9RHOB|nr:proteasome-type protease [Palleronia aestuarii]PZX16040.1 putative proteasome-type protease [Palleronia aestuarii]